LLALSDMMAERGRHSVTRRNISGGSEEMVMALLDRISVHVVPSGVFEPSIWAGSYVDGALVSC